MIARDANFRIFTTLLVAALVAAGLPVLSAPTTSSLSGIVRTAADNGPLVGARVLAADPATGAVLRSNPTGDDGGYSLAGLPPAVYQLAVESSGGLYVVGAPLSVGEAAERRVDLQVKPNQDKSDPGNPVKAGKAGIWNNPFSAALIVLGSAVVVGVLVDNATDDDDEPASPF